MLSKTAYAKPALAKATLKKAQASFGLSTPDLISIRDLAPSEIEGILELTGMVKKHRREFSRTLEGKHIVLMFEKPSLRTRITFEVAMKALGGDATFVDQQEARIDARESLADIAHNLERWVDGIVLRTFEHKTVCEMAEHASVPVVNALSDWEHPCQALADFFTLKDHFGDLRKVKLAYVGDGNNVAHSLLLTAAATGSAITVACPAGYEPAAEVIQAAYDLANETGARIEIVDDPTAAVAEAEAVYTDVWTSMGQESEGEERRGVFLPYQVNSKLMSCAKPGALFMHCLPAHRGEEVVDQVIDSEQSIVFDQAENRLHVQKSILMLLLGNSWSANA
ncbi:MAG TPA: ornithine carbamoyltransferase [Terriglobales bacterium]|nr:ornithine carbamoyltransferase [Terriglobales bacterium]